jgi:hypothetical protein
VDVSVRRRPPCARPPPPAGAEVGETDDEWTEALQRDLDDRIDGTWSLHVSVGGWVVPVVEPWTWKGKPRGLHASAFRAAVELSRWSAWFARHRRVRLHVTPGTVLGRRHGTFPVAAGHDRPGRCPGERCASRTAIPMLSAVRIVSADGLPSRRAVVDSDQVIGHRDPRRRS